jgi:hypothetical protein
MVRTIVARRVSYLLVWLALTAEMAGDCFGGKWETPYTPVGTFLFTPIPGIKFPPWYLLVIATWGWAMSQKPARRGRLVPLATSLKVTFASLALMVVWGAVRGGDLRQTTWQLHGFVMGFVTAQMLAATCTTLDHYLTLGKVIVAATLYRAGILLVFWFSIGKYLDPQLATQTTHADTTLFVSGLLLLGIHALERRTTRAILWAVGSALPVALAIKYNNRRLAWLSLLVGMGIVYVMLPKGKARRRVNVLLAVAAPLAAIYVAVGWGRSEGIFKPVHAISTMMGEHEDSSSETRNIENYNLIMTLKSNPILGSGWGHEYEEVSVAYSIKEFFEQYRYIPHNSVLGVLAFTGLAGFTGIWQVFPVATFFLAHTHRTTNDPRVRMVAQSALVGLVVFVLQMWGDMGMGTITSDVLFAASLAVAMRLPVLAGTWVKPKPSAKPGVDDQNRKDVEHHEHGEADHGAAKPAAPDLVAREEERDGKRPDHDAQEDQLRHGAVEPTK